MAAADSERVTATIQGDPSLKLESYRADAPFEVPADTLTVAPTRR